MSEILYIQKSDILDHNILYNYIYPNEEHNYYFSDIFDIDLYIALAKAGFISTSLFEDNIQYLLPEIQFEYAVLEFKNLHISKKVSKLLKKSDDYIFSINNHFEEILYLLESYHTPSWVTKRYLELLKDIKQNENKDDDFKLLSVELYCTKTNKLVAGEIGYKINTTYTSLSGFALKDNYGKLQMTPLSKYLEENNYSFWNMGHPHMQYKKDIGATILSREDFLNKWLKEIPIDNNNQIKKWVK